jgi:predicted PurR-regulated permease PerM
VNLVGPIAFVERAERAATGQTALDSHQTSRRCRQYAAIVPVSNRTAARLVLVVVLTILAVALALWLLYQLREIVVWLVLALFLTIGLQPAVDWVARRRIPRSLAILISYLGVLIVLAAFVALAAPALIEQGGQLLEGLRKEGGLGGAVQQIASELGFGSAVQAFRPQLDALPAEIAHSFGSFSTVTASTLTVVTGALSVAVLAFFFLYDGAKVVDAAVRRLPEAHQPRVARIVRGSGDAIANYIRGNLAISAIAGLAALVGMEVLRIPYALPLSIVLAVLDLVPMVGATLGAIPVVLAALTVSPIKALIMLAYIIVYQQIESNVLNPTIYGRSDQLPPLVVFLAFLTGSILFGILGALIAVPAANIIRILVRELLDVRSVSTEPAVQPTTPASQPSSPARDPTR